MTLTRLDRIGEAIRVLEQAKDLAPTDKNVNNVLNAALNKRLQPGVP